MSSDLIRDLFRSVEPVRNGPRFFWMSERTYLALAAEAGSTREEALARIEVGEDGSRSVTNEDGGKFMLLD